MWFSLLCDVKQLTVLDGKIDIFLMHFMSNDTSCISSVSAILVLNVSELIWWLVYLYYIALLLHSRIKKWRRLEGIAYVVMNSKL